MAIQLTIQQILSIARVCEYMTLVDSHTRTVLMGGDLNNKQARLIYMERLAVQNRYDLNPSDTTLVATSNYLFSLLRNWPAAQNRLNQIAAGLPVISNPANATVVVGQTATFTVTVISPTPYTVQWYRNGVLIAGATSLSYSLSNAQMTDSGATFNAVATNAAGNVSSLPATLTVETALTARWWYGPDDPYAALAGGTDNLSYQISQAITHNAAIAINYPVGAQNNQFNVLRYPNAENDKITWKNTDLNQGVIPDPTMRAILNINGYKYIVSRDAMSLDNVTTSLTYSP